jgi:heparanase 1
LTRYRVALDPRIVQTIPPWFLSVTIDTSVLIGGRWWGARRGTKEGLAHDRVAPLDLGNPELARWAAPLAPALVRVGGTEADRIGYGFRHDGPGSSDPQPPFVLRGKLWSQLNEWARDQGFGVVFTVSAGPPTPGAARWDGRGAERLIRNTVRKGYPVVGWEFGNEVNAYPFLYGLKRSSSNRRYLEDFATFAALVRRLAPHTKTIGPSSAIWPVIGEPNPLMPALGRSPAAAFLDVMSFHYYPQQSSRGRVAVRRAKESTLLNARTLDGTKRWIRHGRRSLERGPAAGRPLWITETGHALYGGEPGLSDTWLSTPWWLDQLGLMAHEGVETVFRQSLVGGDYGLLGEKTFVPRPDYFASLLWKAHMGGHVHGRPRVEGADRRLRAWHHEQPDGRSCVLLINLSRTKAARVDLGPGQRSVHLLEPLAGPTSRMAVLNGLSLAGVDGLNRIGVPMEPGTGPVDLPPLSCGFVGL